MNGIIATKVCKRKKIKGPRALLLLKYAASFNPIDGRAAKIKITELATIKTRSSRHSRNHSCRGKNPDAKISEPTRI